MAISIMQHIKSQVSKIWCDNITWRGNLVSLSSSPVLKEDRPGALVEKWQEDLDKINLALGKDKIKFQLVQFGWSRMKDGGSRTSATFELKFL